MLVSRADHVYDRCWYKCFLPRARLIARAVYVKKNLYDNNGRCCTRQKAFILYFQTAEWLFNLDGLFSGKGTSMKNRGRNDDRCVRRWKKMEKEWREKKRACTFPMRYRARMDGRIYIRVITAIRHTERAYIRVYIDSSMSFFLYSASPSDGTFLVGARAKITDGKLGVRPIYVGVSPHLSRETGRVNGSLADLLKQRVKA